MRLNQFHYLVAIHEYGSIAGASRALYVSQPSVSTAVRELEAELGFPILIRDRRHTVFSPKGKLVLEIAQNILRETGRLTNLAGITGDEIWGSFSIGGSSYFFDTLLLNTIVSLRARFPHLSIRVGDNDSLRLFSMVRDGGVNIGVVIYCHIDEGHFREKIAQYDLTWAPLLSDEMIFIVGDTHPLAGRASVSLEELLSYPLAIYKSPLHELALEMFRRYRRDLDILFIDDYSSLWKLAAISERVTLCPQLAYRHKGHSGLAAVRISDFDYTYSLCWVLRNAPPTPAEKCVLAELSAQAAALQETHP